MLDKLFALPQPLDLYWSLGIAFSYMDANDQTLKRSEVTINATNHALAYTLQQVYDNYQSEVGFYCWRRMKQISYLFLLFQYSLMIRWVTGQIGDMELPN